MQHICNNKTSVIELGDYIENEFILLNNVCKSLQPLVQVHHFYFIIWFQAIIPIVGHWIFLFSSMYPMQVTNIIIIVLHDFNECYALININVYIYHCLKLFRVRNFPSKWIWIFLNIFGLLIIDTNLNIKHFVFFSLLHCNKIQYIFHLH